MTTTSSASQATSTITVQQQHEHQQTVQENEQFALTWLRATYELCSGSRVNDQELYKHYLGHCAKIGRRGVISPLHFPRCVRLVYLAIHYDVLCDGVSGTKVPTSFNLFRSLFV